jgi:hypothetical protein
MKIELTCRGFERVDFKDANGNSCSIQQSSTFDDDTCNQPGAAYLWLGANKNSVHPTTGEEMSPRMHLNRDLARQLAALLLLWADNGTLKDGE